MEIRNNGPAIFVPDYEELMRKVEACRILEKTIVLTSGVYDRWHTGHIRYLASAKSEGDVLVVALDTDALVRKRKGVGRPFDSMEERVEAVCSHWAVDIVTKMDVSDDSDYLLKIMRPDVFVISQSTGPETQKKIEVFKKLAGKVVNLPPQSSESTTAKERRHKIQVMSEVSEIVNNALKEAQRKISGESPSKSNEGGHS